LVGRSGSAGRHGSNRRYTTEIFEKAGVSVTPKSYEADVKGIVTKVTLGEADAGIEPEILVAGRRVDDVNRPPTVVDVLPHICSGSRRSTPATGIHSSAIGIYTEPASPMPRSAWSGSAWVVV
jgi:hypothetical protein